MKNDIYQRTEEKRTQERKTDPSLSLSLSLSLYIYIYICTHTHLIVLRTVTNLQIRPFLLSYSEMKGMWWTPTDTFETGHIKHFQPAKFVTCFYKFPAIGQALCDRCAVIIDHWFLKFLSIRKYHVLLTLS